MYKISFVIPVYNCKSYLQGCIGSIEKIGLPDYEVLLIDDGSMDGSAGLCDSMADSRWYVHTFHQSNSGVSAARNAGLAKATGDYIIFIDADDDISPLKMKDAIHCLELTPVDLVIYGLSFDFYHKGSRYRRDELRCPFTGLVERSRWMQQLDKLYFANALSPIWNKIYRRQFLLDNGLTLREDMFLYEDLEYSLRCLKCCDQILFYPDVVYHYRQSEDEGNAGRRLKRIANLSEFLEKIEMALRDLTESHAEKTNAEQVNDILLALYLVLAREKINVSSSAEIKRICDDFYIWFEERNMRVSDEQREYVQLLLNRKVGSLIRKRTYTNLRHKIAVLVKSFRVREKC